MATKKRGQNEGGLYQRASDDLWVGAVDLGYVDGKRRRKTVYGKTQAEALGKLRQLERERDAGLDLKVKGQTTEAYLKTWLVDSMTPSVRPKTAHSYAQMARLHIIPSVGRVRLDQLNAQDVQKMMSTMTTAGLAPRTVQYARAILRKALADAMRWGLVTRNAAALATPPRSVRRPVEPLTASEAGQLIEYATEHEPRLEPLLAVALMTGLRMGELAGLTWGSVDLVRGTLKVERTLQRVGGGWTYTEPKTRRSARSLALPVRAVQALRRQQDRQRFEEVEAKARWSTAWDEYGGLVFRTLKGTPIEPSNLNGRLHKLLDGIGLPRQGIHSLRHACASMMVAQGIPLRSVMEQLGHSQISLTADTYTHLVPTMLRDNADALDRAMTGT